MDVPQTYSAMPEEGARGQLLPLPFSKGAKGARRPSTGPYFIVVISFFASICAFPV